MKTILYATDYSKNSELALKYAHNMSHKMNAKLLVIHVFDYPVVLKTRGLIPQAQLSDMKADALKKHNSKIKAFCTRVLKTATEALNIEINAIANTSVVKGIADKAKTVDALLIVTGMKGTSKLGELIKGSTVKRLIQKAPCPVFRVPSDSVKTEIQTIVYATDFEEEDLGAMDKLTEIAKPFNAKIKVVHISSLDQSIGDSYRKDLEDKIDKHIDYPNLKLDVLYADDAFNALKMYYHNANADVIGMLERKTSGFSSKVFHRDLVKRMVSYGKIPLLSFNAKNYGIFHLE